MHVSMIGPENLSHFDQEEIQNYLDILVPQGTHIHLMIYKNIELEVFKYFVKNQDFCSQLHLYSIQPSDALHPNYQTTISFLEKNGASFQSFYHQDPTVLRPQYIEYWEKIISSSDSVICFYNQQMPRLFIPIDIALKKEKRGIVFHLPGEDETKFRLPTLQKIEDRSNNKKLDYM